ncbi:MAG: aminopeptidase P N-terminal domain-containing protein, partial [Candidatus Aminicenantes bacterium]|nr:aminopeptidase P N-terminal domain-containing protein [Candidatus Aminicenantes bacterium]
MRTHKRSIVWIGSILILSAVSANTVLAQTSDAAAARRKALSKKIGRGLAVVPAQTPSARGPQENKDFYYLTGIMEPESVLVVLGEDEKKETLFNRSGKWAGPSETTLNVLPSADLRKFFMSRAAEIRVKGRAFGSPLARGLYPRASTAEVDPRAKPGALTRDVNTRLSTAEADP